MSRKTILVVVAVLGALLTAFQVQFGLTLKGSAVAAGLGAVLVYVLFEAKADAKRISSQPGKWKDPKWIMTAVSAALVAFSQASGSQLPVEAIVAVLTVAVSVLFKTKAA